MKQGKFFSFFYIVIPDDRFINEVSRRWHAHNHTHVQETQSYILRTVFKFFLNIDSQRSKGRFTFIEKNLNFTSVSS